MIWVLIVIGVCNFCLLLCVLRALYDVWDAVKDIYAHALNIEDRVKHLSSRLPKDLGEHIDKLKREIVIKNVLGIS